MSNKIYNTFKTTFTTYSLVWRYGLAGTMKFVSGLKVYYTAPNNVFPHMRQAILITA